MKHHNVMFVLAVLAATAATVATAVAQQQVTPPPPIVVTTPIITINGSPGDQTDPHVNKDLASYTDTVAGQIHYYSFLSMVDAAIPSDPTFIDILSDVNGGRIAFSRIEPDRNAIFIFDTATASLTEIDPHVGSNRLGSAIGGNTLAFVDLGSPFSRVGHMFAYDLAANPPLAPVMLGNSTNIQQNPNVAPDGNSIVWEDCPVSITNCDVLKAIRSGGTWTVSTVVNSPYPEGNPDTDGTWITYDVNDFTGFGGRIHYQPVSGGIDVELAIAGSQENPSISKGFIGFESRATSSPADLFVYDIANNFLYQVTSTPTVHESLNNISVLDNGDVRMVWMANDGAAGDQDIHATTFTPVPHQVSYHICPLYDQNVAKKSGSTYPIKLQLCDASGNNLSSPSIAVHAVSVTRISTDTPATLDDTGSANPDFDFRYDASLAGYIFNLSTTGYATGTYSLNFTAGSDPALHSALFAVK
jgi:hypothetical protein